MLIVKRTIMHIMLIRTHTIMPFMQIMQSIMHMIPIIKPIDAYRYAHYLCT